MTDITNPNVIPTLRESEEDQHLIERGEDIIVTFRLQGKDALEYRRYALRQGMSTDNFGKYIALSIVRKLRIDRPISRKKGIRF